MKLGLLISFHFIFTIALGQNSIINGRVTYKSSGLSPIEGVTISAFGANTIPSNTQGMFSLSYNTKSAGDKASIRAFKEGYRVVNQKILESLRIPSNADDVVDIIMCKESEWLEDVQSYYGILIKTIDDGYEKRLEELQSNYTGDIHLASDEKRRLQDQRDEALERAEQTAEMLASINLDQASDWYKEAFEAFQDGEVEKAIELLDDKKLEQAFRTAQVQMEQAQEEILRVIESFNLKIEALIQTMQFEKALESYDKLLNLVEGLEIEISTFKSDLYKEIASISFQQGAFKKSLEKSEQYLEILKQDGGTIEEIVELMMQIGMSHYYLGYSQKGLDIHLEALEKIENVDPLLSARVNDNLGYIYNGYFEYTKALNHAKRGVAIKEKLPNISDFDLGESYLNLSKILVETKSFPEGLEYAEKAKELLIKAGTQHRDKLADCYGHLSELFSALGQYDKALQNINKAIEIEESIYSNKSYFLGASYNLKALTLGAMGNYEEAINFGRKAEIIAKELYEKNETVGPLVIVLGVLGSLYEETGDLDYLLYLSKEALDLVIESSGTVGQLYFDEALDYVDALISAGKYTKAETELNHISDQFKRDTSLLIQDKAAIYTELGVNYSHLGRTKPTIQNLEKAIELYINFYDSSSFKLIRPYNALGIEYFSLGNVEEAIKFQIKSKDIAEKVLPSNSKGLATVYRNLGMNFTNVGQFDKGKLFIEKGIYIIENGEFVDSIDLANAYQNYSFFLSKIGEYDLSFQYKWNAKGIAERNLPENQIALIRYFRDVADGFKTKKDYEKALKYEKKALEIAKLKMNPDAIRLAKILRSIGESYYKLGLFDLSEKSILHAIKIFEKHDDWGNLKWSYYYLQQHHEALKNYPASIDALHKVIEYQKLEDPDEKQKELAIWYNNLALLYEKNDELDLALNSFEKIYLLDQKGKVSENFKTSYKENTNNFISRTISNLALQRKEAKAIEFGEKALEVSPNNFEINWRVGMAYYSLEEYEKVEPYLKKALELNPEFEKGYLHLSSINHSKLGKLKEAKKQIDLHAKLDSATNYQIILIYYAQQENIDQLIVTLEEAFDNGFNRVKWLKNDNGFDKVRDNDRFQAILNQYSDTKTIEKAEKHYKEKEYKEAIKWYELALESNVDPKVKGLILYNLALSYSALKQYEKSIDCGLEYLDINQKNEIAYYNVGMSFYNLGNYSKAAEYFKKATGLNSSYAYAFYYWGNCFYNLKAYGKAVGPLKRAVELNIEKKECLFRLGRSLTNIGRYDESIDYLNQYLKLDSSSVLAYNQIGVSLQKKGAFEEALQAYEQALKLKPEDPTILSNMALLYKDNEAFEEAIPYYKRSLVIDSMNVTQNINLVKCYHSVKDYSSAIFHLKKALERQTNELTYLMLLGQSYEYQNDIENALKTYHQITEVAPEAKKFYGFNQIGALYFRKKDYVKAEEYFAKAVENGPEYLKAVKNLAMTYYNLGNYQMALQQFSKVLILNPNDHGTMNYIGICYSKLGKHQEEAIYMLKASQKDTTNLTYQSNLGFAFYRNENYQKALSIFEKILVKQSDFKNALLGKGLCYNGMEQHEKAKNAFENLVTLHPQIARYYLELAIAYRNVEDYQNAIDNCTKALDLEATYFEALKKRANYHFLAKDFQSAIMDYSSCIKIDSTDYDFFNARGRAKHELGLYEGAVSDYDKANTLAPAAYYKTYLNNKSLSLVKAKKFDPARVLIKEFEVFDPFNGRVYRNWGAYYALKNQPDLALFNIKKAVQLGYSDINWMKNDDSIESLRNREEYQKILLNMEQ